MATDFKLTEGRDITDDSTGDYAAVTGYENIRQQHANAVFRATTYVEPKLVDADAEAEFENGIETELEQISYVNTIELIDVEARGGGVLVATVVTDVIDDPLEREVTL